MCTEWASSETIEIAKRLSEGYPVRNGFASIRGVCYKIRTDDYVPKSVVELASYERVKEDKRDYAIASRRELEEACHAVRGETLIQRHGKYILVQNRCRMSLLDTKQLDYVYSLPYRALVSKVL